MEWMRAPVRTPTKAWLIYLSILISILKKKTVLASAPLIDETGARDRSSTHTHLVKSDSE
jgi:hypothetical protein